MWRSSIDCRTFDRLRGPRKSLMNGAGVSKGLSQDASQNRIRYNKQPGREGPESQYVFDEWSETCSGEAAGQCLVTSDPGDLRHGFSEKRKIKKKGR